MPPPVSPARVVVSIAHQMGRHLRPEHYAFLLNQAATTGFLPRLDRYGRPVMNDEGQELPVKERLQTLQYLVDKVLPAAKAQSAPNPIDPLSATLAPEELSAAELIRITNTPLEEAEEVALDAAPPQPPADYDPEHAAPAGHY